MKKHLQFLLLCCAAVAGGCKNEASSGTDAEMDRFIDELMSRPRRHESEGQWLGVEKRPETKEN